MDPALNGHAEETAPPLALPAEPEMFQRDAVNHPNAQPGYYDDPRLRAAQRDVNSAEEAEHWQRAYVRSKDIIRLQERDIAYFRGQAEASQQRVDTANKRAFWTVAALALIFVLTIIALPRLDPRGGPPPTQQTQQQGVPNGSQPRP